MCYLRISMEFSHCTSGPGLSLCKELSSSHRKGYNCTRIFILTTVILPFLCCVFFSSSAASSSIFFFSFSSFLNFLLFFFSFRFSFFFLFFSFRFFLHRGNDEIMKLWFISYQDHFWKFLQCHWSPYPVSEMVSWDDNFSSSNSSGARDGIFWLWGSIPCLLMPWLLKLPEHQPAWYWLGWADSMYYCCSWVNFIYLGPTESNIRFKM